MQIILDNFPEADELRFVPDIDPQSMIITIDDMQFRISEDSVIIDRKEIKCLYINFIDQRGADRLHILPASSNAIHLTGGR